MTNYDVLGVNSNTPNTEIKKRYKFLTSKVHPDKGGSNSLFVLVKNSYEQVLLGNGSRNVYDQPSDTVCPSQKDIQLQYIQLLRENMSLKNEIKYLKLELDNKKFLNILEVFFKLVCPVLGIIMASYVVCYSLPLGG